MAVTVRDNCRDVTVTRGAQGASGFSGQSGGTSGASGRSGYSGISGAKGISGYSGRSGASGFSAAIGPSGRSGYSGRSGFSGLMGISGYSGKSGTSGFSGQSSSGVSGRSGWSGRSGFSSASGFSGISGIGSSGYSGWSGKSGLSGMSAQSGHSGASGFSGTFSGFSGRSGFSAFSGFSGTSGTSGRSGYSGSSGFSGRSGFSGYVPLDTYVPYTGAAHDVVLGDNKFKVGTATTPDSAADTTLASQAVGDKVLVVQGKLSQTNNLIDCQDSTNVSLAWVAADGQINTITSVKAQNESGQATFTSTKMLDNANVDSIFWTARTLWGSGALALDWANRYLVDTNGDTVLDWQAGNLYNETNDPGNVIISLPNQTLNRAGVIAVDWANRLLKTTGAVRSLDWENRKTLSSTNDDYSIDWGGRFLINSGLNNSVDWENGYLNKAGTPTVKWDANQWLIDASNQISVDWSARALVDSTGGPTRLNWQDSQTFDNGSIETIDWNSRILYANFEGSPEVSVDWASRTLKKHGGGTMLDWSGDSLTGAFVGLVPIGAIIAWNKSLAGTPSLTPDFVECSGQILSDPDSPLNGQVIPDLNNYAGGDAGGRFLRGAQTTGGTGGSISHGHTLTNSLGVDSSGLGVDTMSLSVSGSPGTTTDSADAIAPTLTVVTAVDIGTLALSGSASISGSASLTGSIAVDDADTMPLYYHVTWIMRIK